MIAPTETREIKSSSEVAWGWKLFLLLLPILAAIFSLCVGRYAMAPGDILHAFTDKITGAVTVSPQVTTVLWSMRMPRILLAMIAGAGLSAAGCAFQSLFSNPLATPDTLGVASGASFGAALALLFGLKMLGVQVISLTFGLLALALTALAGTGKRQRNLNSIVLAGIMIGSLFTALVSLVKFSADTESQLPAITYWLMGSLDSASYDSLSLGAPPILLGIVVLLLLRWRLNLLPLSEEEARTTGVNIKAIRIVTILCATLITGSVISMCGQVGWVGLLIPHMCRMKFGNNHTALLPASVLAGGAFLIVVDTACRSLSAAEFPISILTAIIGAPFFIYLMRKSGGWQL